MDCLVVYGVHVKQTFLVRLISFYTKTFPSSAALVMMEVFFFFLPACFYWISSWKRTSNNKKTKQKKMLEREREREEASSLLPLLLGQIEMRPCHSSPLRSGSSRSGPFRFFLLLLLLFSKIKPSSLFPATNLLWRSFLCPLNYWVDFIRLLHLLIHSPGGGKRDGKFSTAEQGGHLEDKLHSGSNWSE